MREVTIREVAEADLGAIWRACEEAGIGGSVCTAEEAREQVTRMRQYPFYRIFVAETDGTIAGTYRVSP